MSGGSKTLAWAFAARTQRPLLGFKQRPDADWNCRTGTYLIAAQLLTANQSIVPLDHFFQLANMRFPLVWNGRRSEVVLAACQSFDPVV